MKKILTLLHLSSLLIAFVLCSCSKRGPYEIRQSGIFTNPPNSTGGGASPPPPSNCSFWLKDPYAFGDIYIQVPSGILSLTVGTETKILYYYYNESGPTGCGLTGTLGFNLPAGLHTWRATSLNGSRSVTGTVLITNTGCSLKEIVW